ncbi:MAG: amidohydrolase [Steroidobacteraceae bacterium]
MKHRTLAALAALLSALPTLALAGAGVVVNARIHTMDEARPEAEAMAWDDTGRVVAVGSRAAVLAAAPGAPVRDLHGSTVVPGLIDAHGHLMSLGYALMEADLVGTRSKAEVIERLRAFEATLPPGGWLTGRGWDQNDWPQHDFPTAADLDAAFPDRPVWLERIDGHAGWANTAAMRRVGRDLDGDWQPQGGRIVRAGTRATGVFVDTATDLVSNVVPPPDSATREEALRRALAATARVGLTGVHDMGTSLEDLDLYRRFADAGTLTLRVNAYADGDGAALDALCRQGTYQHPGGRLRMGGVKLYADGALGSRGAALLSAYADDPRNRGILVTTPEALSAAAVKAHRCHVQVATHAIGDRGNRIVLETYAYALGDQARTDHRWRIEHAQVVALQDIRLFADLRVIASMQPTHATSDMPWAEARIGPQRLEGAYAWRRFLDAHVRLALGSDFPVESADPRLGLYAAVTRQDLSGFPPGGWLPSQKLTPYEALRGFTSDAAWAGFTEREVGRLTTGRRADFVVLGADPLNVPPKSLPMLPVLSTWVDGVPVYEQ